MTEQLPILRTEDEETIEDLRAEITRLRMALADTEALEIGTGERCIKLADEVERLKVERDNHQLDVNADLRQQLAASQLSEKKLREALGKVHQCCLYSEDDGLIGITQEPNIDSLLLDEICKALTTPSSTEALDAYVAEVRNGIATQVDIHITKCGGLTYGVIDKIRKGEF